MSYLQLKNNAKTTLANAITAGVTSLTVRSATSFPTSGDFLVTIWNSSTYSDPGDDSNMEILKVTAVSGNTFTVTRAQESTIAKAHSSGHAVQMLITAGILEEIQDAIKDNFSELDDTPSSYSGQGGKGVRVKGTEDGIEFYVPTDLDEKIKISSNDTTPDYLNGKLVAGAGITLTEIGDGGDETLSIINNDKGSTAISTHEITYDHSNLHTQNTDTVLQQPSSVEIDDQFQDHFNAGDIQVLETSTDYDAAQIFTPNKRGDLSKIDFKIYKEGASSDLIVELRATSSGVPTSTVLTSTTFPHTDFGEGAWTDKTWTLATPYTLVKGTAYAIVFRSATDDYWVGNNGNSWNYDTDATYYSYYYYADKGVENWATYSNYQAYFKTHMNNLDLIYNNTLKANLLVDSGITIDGRDISVDGTKLDTIETNADVTDVANVTTALASITVNAHSDITSAGADIEDAVTKKHTQNTDTALGAQSEDLDMNTHKIVGVVDPVNAQEAATKKYVDDAVEVENLWDRAGTTLSPHTANDSVDLGTGKIEAGGLNVFGDLVKTRNVTVGRTSGLVSSIVKTGGRTLTITRNANTNGITSIADGTRTWTISRNGNDRMTAIAIA